MVVIAILTTMMSMAVPLYRQAREEAEETVAIREIRSIETEIELYVLNNGQLPDSLADLNDFNDLLDPWGNPYQFVNFSNIKGNGKKRKDKFLVPLNSTYDLYSMGPDGQSATPLTASSSQDDIIRANDGEFVGVAAAY